MAQPESNRSTRRLSEPDLIGALREAVEPLPPIGSGEFGGHFDRLGEADVIALGEASHGTSEFYRARAAITRRLIERHGVNVVAVEADWPDAARIDRYVRHRSQAPWRETAFARFPTWMWRNEEVLEFVEWLREHNAGLPPERRVSFHGVDLYALNSSIQSVVGYLDEVDPEAASAARERYSCFTPWQEDPAAYGRATIRRGLHTCENAVLQMLQELLEKRLKYAQADPDDYLDATGNAHLIASAEAYYRSIYYGAAESWNLRDHHMFETLRRVCRARCGKAVIWAHNSHLGDATATEMGTSRHQLNVGQLCREHYGERAVLVGVGTDRGEVAAASDWGGSMEIKAVRPARNDSIEGLCRKAGVPCFLLDLAQQAGTSLGSALLEPRLERAIGVIYRPDTERMSHYFEARLARQFDHYIWFEETHAVRPLGEEQVSGAPDTYPFGV